MHELAFPLLAGLILLGAAPCTAMVFVWSNLCRGNANFTISQVALNDLVMVFAFAPIVAFLLGVSAIPVPWDTLLLSVVMYIVIPLAIAQGLRKHFLRGGEQAFKQAAERIAPFTIMSSDNIQANGEVAHKMFAAYAMRKDKALGEWVEANVAFPNAMVDRITPVTAPADIEQVKTRFGIDDAWPVVCEPFTQWVLEDHFPLGRPEFEKAEVQLVADVVPYELMKLRLLNASHQALTYFGYLAGYRYAHEVTQDPLFETFLLNYMELEGTPTLMPVPGVDLDLYRKTLIARFANPEVKDTLARLCAESSDRIPKWLVPVIRANLASGGEIKRSAAVVASWARYAEGKDEQGEPIVVVDRMKDELMAIAQHNRENITAFIENREVFGDLCDNARFVTAYTEALQSLYHVGAKETVRRYA